MSASKAKGTAAETAVVNFLKDQGYSHVERRALHGTNDRGDIAGIPGLVIEVKNCKAMSLAAWIDEAETERENDGASCAVVFHKRVGRGNPADWYVSMSGEDFVEFLHHWTGLGSEGWKERKK